VVSGLDAPPMRQRTRQPFSSAANALPPRPHISPEPALRLSKGRSPGWADEEGNRVPFRGRHLTYREEYEAMTIRWRPTLKVQHKKAHEGESRERPSFAKTAKDRPPRVHARLKGCATRQAVVCYFARGRTAKSVPCWKCLSTPSRLNGCSGRGKMTEQTTSWPAICAVMNTVPPGRSE